MDQWINTSTIGHADHQYYPLIGVRFFKFFLLIASIIDHKILVKPMAIIHLFTFYRSIGKNSAEITKTYTYL
jgi:hypothetical protein